jgi:hypothetical protein
VGPPILIDESPGIDVHLACLQLGSPGLEPHWGVTIRVRRPGWRMTALDSEFFALPGETRLNSVRHGALVRKEDH